MRHVWVIVVRGVVPTPSFAGIEVNSTRGEQVFLAQGCPSCHTVRGEQQKAATNAAPNIVSRLDRNYTAASMASEFWNHAPQMWEATKKSNAQAGVIRVGCCRSVRIFYAVRFFESLGDGGRISAFSPRSARNATLLQVVDSRVVPFPNGARWWIQWT